MGERAGPIDLDQLLQARARLALLDDTRAEITDDERNGYLRMQRLLDAAAAADMLR
jgi:hypothetical protein